MQISLSSLVSSFKSSTCLGANEIVDCDLRTAADIVMDLKKQGFVIPTPGSKSGDFAKSGKPMFHAASVNPEHAKLMAAYFDPALHIAHLVSLAC
jgi:hypothetical protein